MCLMMFSLLSMAQSDYISNSRVDSLDCIMQLDGKRGILLLSRSNNLVITVTNVPDAVINPKGIDHMGYYEYEVIVGPDDSNPKLEVNMRGDVNITSFVANPKKDYYVAYLIELVATPIDLQDQSKGGAYLDASKFQLVFISPFPNLSVNVNQNLKADISTKPRKEDNVYETSVIIPIEPLKEARERMEVASKSFKDHTASLNEKSVDADFIKDDELKAEMEKATEIYGQMANVSIHSDGTNTLTIPIGDMAPREKKTYAVLLLNKVKKEFVTECSAHMAEAGRLFGLREYEGAKTEYTNALNAKDTPANLKNTILTQLAQCDSCDVYQKLAVASLLKIRDMKKSGVISQADLAKYASSASEFLKVVSKYNPSVYYTERIEKLDKMVGNLPLEFQITTTRWVKDVAGFSEDGPMQNVEAWGYFGNAPIVGKEYSTDKRFEKLLNSSAEFKKLGTSDENGIIKMELMRKDLPKFIFFRAKGYVGRVGIECKSMNHLMLQSNGDYMTRQFRLKMYLNN